VAKIDLSEIRAPFLKAGLIAGFISVLVILGGTTLFVRISNPMIKLLEEHNTSLEIANTRLRKEMEERSRAERAVRDSEQKYRQLVEQLQEGIWAIDKDANTTFVNPRMAEMIGYTVDEMQGKHLFSFMDERGVEISQRNLERRKQGIKEQHDFEFIHKNGQRIYTSIETSPIKDENGNYIGALACVADITARKKAEEELSKLNLELEERVKQRTEQLEAEIVERIQAEETLRKNKEMLQMIFDGISDPLLMLNAKLEVRLLNRAASEYYFVDQKNVLGKLCYQAFRRRSAPCEGCEIQSAILNHYYEMFERKGFMDSNKTEKVFIYPIGDGHDGLDSAIIRISDITQEKMLQRQIVQTEKLSSLGFLVSGVAHEINNPNNFITFNIPILKEYLNEIIPIMDDYAKKHENLELCCMLYPEFRNDIFKLVKNIENGSRRIQAAVSNLRGITRVKDKLQMDLIDIQEVIERCVPICRAKIDRLVESFEVDIAKDLPRINADPESLELVIINLLINAAQAADKDNSWIKLHVSLGDSAQNHVIIEVRDNGCGMDEKTQTHIFDPFFTTKSPSEGTGLGLTLCLNSIKELGGQIEVDSIQGKGSTFRVILPDKENRPAKRL
jgi:PAS domain S-box-containing protein